MRTLLASHGDQTRTRRGRKSHANNAPASKSPKSPLAGYGRRPSPRRGATLPAQNQEGNNGEGKRPIQHLPVSHVCVYWSTGAPHEGHSCLTRGHRWLHRRLLPTMTTLPLLSPSPSSCFYASAEYSPPLIPPSSPLIDISLTHLISSITRASARPRRLALSPASSFDSVV